MQNTIRIKPILKTLVIAMGVIGVVSLGACQSMKHGTGQKASAKLEPRSGSATTGEVVFIWQGHDVMVSGKFTGLRPNAEQGFHVHE